MGTFHAKYPLLQFPIDHVFVSDGFRVPELSRHTITGSDHFAVSTTIVDANPTIGTTPDPQTGNRSEAAEIISEGKADAEAQDVLQ
jgi:hypothetical protein